MIKPLLLLTLSVGWIMSPTSEASVLVSLNGTAPSGDIIRANEFGSTPPSNVIAYWRGPGATDQVKTIGQGFSLSAGSQDYMFDGVSFHIQNFHSAVLGKDFRIDIYQSSGISTAPSITNHLIGFDGSLPDELITGNYIRFDFNDSVKLETGFFYNVVFSFSELTSTNSDVQGLSFSTVGSGVSITSGGRRWIGADGSYSNAANNGFVFYAHGTAIPEPSIFALAGLGIGLAAFFKRRHA